MITVKSILGLFLASLFSTSASMETVTAGTYYDVSGEGTEVPTLEQLMMLNECEARHDCFHVVKLKKSGELKKVSSTKELEELEKSGDVAVAWKRTNRRFQNVAFKQDTKGFAGQNAPALAVDGSRDNKFTSCFHTNSVDIRPWWRVGFGAPVLVHSVTITNAGVDHSGLASLFKGVDIRIGYQDESRVNPLCRQNISIATPTTVDFECEREMTGTFLFVEKEEKQLFLCEVEVYGIFI